LFGDETGADQGRNPSFFIYGAIFLPMDSVAGVHDAVSQIRRRNGFRARDPLKFNGRERPERVTAEAHRTAKTELIQEVHSHGVRFTSCAVLHELAANRDRAELIQWGANSVLAAFNTFLEEEDDIGFAVFDRIPVQVPDNYLREKFQSGLVFPSGASRQLDRIKGYAFSCDGASHLSSVVDVVLGAFRYCVNERNRDRAPREILPGVVRLMWHRREGDRIRLRDRGLLLRPATVRAACHKREYDALVDRLTALLRPAQQ
jgi:hypothetical protein